MPRDRLTSKALATGRSQAGGSLKRRDAARRKRAAALAARAKPKGKGRTVTAAATAGLLVAEGDSWFDYPGADILAILEDEFGYDVESVAHRGDPVEDMAYGGTQLDDFTRRIDKVKDRGARPKAILLSGGGNDVAGPEFSMLLNHQASPIGGFSNEILDAVIDQRVRLSYVTILSRVSEVCRARFGATVPILVHGYDYPVPDGRGFLGGWWFLPGPWLKPGFVRKGFGKIETTKKMARELIDRFNGMLAKVAAMPEFAHVDYVDLRGTLPTGPGYTDWWANELHPTHKGFDKVTGKLASALAKLPSS